MELSDYNKSYLAFLEKAFQDPGCLGVISIKKRNCGDLGATIAGIYYALTKGSLSMQCLKEDPAMVTTYTELLKSYHKIDVEFVPIYKRKNTVYAALGISPVFIGYEIKLLKIANQ